MDLLLFFVLGIIAMRYIFPLLDQLLSWLLTSIEARKDIIMVQRAECEKQMADIAAKIDAPPANQIGFVIPTEEVEDFEDDI